MQFVELKTEDYASVCSFYNDVQQALGSSTNHPEIIPDIKRVTSGFQFDKYIIPSNPSIAYTQGLSAYKSRSKALKKKLMHPKVILKDCLTLTNIKHVHAHKKVGFKFLLKLLGSILPHLGGCCLDVVQKINKIKV